jgi:hypothetical protein
LEGFKKRFLVFSFFSSEFNGTSVTASVILVSDGMIGELLLAQDVEARAYSIIHLELQTNCITVICFSSGLFNCTNSAHKADNLTAIYEPIV